MRRRLRLLVMLVSTALVAALCQGAVFVAAPTAAPALADAAQGAGGQFVPAQGRILETRPAYQVGPYNSPMAAGVWRKVTVAGSMMSDGSKIPANISAVSVNFGVVDPAGAGYLNADKDDGSPTAAIAYMRFTAGDDQSNSATVAVAPNGNIQVKSSQNTNLFIDVQGYYTSDSDVAPGGYIPVTPKRIIDTYYAIGVPKAKLSGGSATTIPIASSANGVPAGATAAIVNITTANHNSTANHYYTAYAADDVQPPKLGTYFATANSDATESQVALSTTGSPVGAFKLVMSPGTYTVDVQVDILGYFSPGSSTSGVFTPAANRVYATGSADSQSPPRSAVAAGATRTVQVSGVNGLPANDIGITAVALHISVYDHGTSGGYISAWASGKPRPSPYSSVNLVRNGMIGNRVTTQLGLDGAVSVYNASQDPVDVLVDVEGWYSAPYLPPATPCVQPTVSTTCNDDNIVTADSQTVSAQNVNRMPCDVTFDFWSGVSEPVAPVAAPIVPNVGSLATAQTAVALAAGQDYLLRVRCGFGTDEAVSGWSRWYSFNVDIGDSVAAPVSTPDNQPYNGTDEQKDAVVDNYWSEERVSSATDATVVSAPDDGGAQAPHMDATGATNDSSAETVDASEPVTPEPPADASNPEVADTSAPVVYSDGPDTSTRPDGSRTTASTDNTTAKTRNAAAGKLYFHNPMNNRDSFCTASLLNTPTKSQLLTAGHCVHSGGKNHQIVYFSNFRFYPEKVGNNNPRGFWRGLRVGVTSVWKTRGCGLLMEDYPSAFCNQGFTGDYAIVTLQKRPNDGKRAGDVIAMNGYIWNSSTYGGDYSRPVQIYGYPENFSNGKYMMLCKTTSRKSQGMVTNMLQARCGMAGGSSGGPWIDSRTWNARSRYGLAVGVMSTFAGPRNYGAYLRTPVTRLLKAGDRYFNERYSGGVCGGLC